MKYPQFLKRFPTITALGSARQRDVVIAWQGMGYNNRAVRLHQLARTVVQKYRGAFPHTYDTLLALPGIGRYTANALLVSAFRKTVPIVDVNVRRLFSRFFWRMKTTAQMKPENEIWKLAEELIPAGRAYEWNQALMDLGAMICTARTPHCPDCPVAGQCSSRVAMRKATMAPHKREPSRDGIPNRIYRGRIIEALRQQNGRKSLNADSVGRTIHAAYSAKHKPWLASLLADLERDGLIRTIGNGRWDKLRVVLA